MIEILIKAGAFVTIILIGYILKRINFVKEDDFHLLSKIVLKVTLPAAIISNFAGTVITPAFLIITLLGFLAGVILIVCGLILTKGKSKSEKAFHVINVPGYNIGNFSLPFVQGFLGSVGVVTTSLFDAGNAIIILGVTFSLAMFIKGGDHKTSVSSVLKTLFKSVAFDAYLLMTVLSLLKLSLPAPLLELSSIIGGANTFLALFMIGVGFKLSGDKGQIKKISKILFVRYSVSIMLSVIFYNFLPFPIEYRRTLAILAFSPISSAAPAFTAEADEDFGLASALNSISILISIAAITLTLIILL